VKQLGRFGRRGGVGTRTGAAETGAAKKGAAKTGAAGVAGLEPTATGVTAFDAFYREQYAPMVRLARLLTGSVAVAEDLTHDAFVRVAPRLGSLERPAAYLRTTVVNACRSHHRHQAVVDRSAPSPAEPSPPSHLVDFADALGELPERQRTAIVLRYYGDLDDREIAEILGCRRPTVRTLVRRGMTALREVIEP
jgi:DNA-directed RNA polymerase specialized sigma24 family protein